MLRRLGQTARTLRSPDLSVERAVEANAELFGSPDEQFFGARLGALRQKAMIIAEAEGAQADIARELLHMTGEVATPTEQSPQEIELSAEQMARFRGDLFAVLPALSEQMVEDKGQTYSAAEAVPYFQSMLDALGMDEEGWIARNIPGKSASTSADKKQIGIGEARQSFTASGINATRIHEVVFHGYRMYSASRNADAGRQTAAPGSLAFEEGLAVMYEQILNGKLRIAGEQYHLALGLWIGLDKKTAPTDQPESPDDLPHDRHVKLSENDQGLRTFREVYEIMWRRSIVDSAAKGEPIDDEKIQKAKDAAYQICLRTDRGGAPDMRDLSYSIGAIKALKWLNSIVDLPDEERRKKLRWVLSARFDPTDDLQAEVYADNMNEAA